MRRLAIVSVMAVGSAFFVPGWSQPAGASSGTTILAPTSVKAVSFDGVRGVLVSWQPLPAGGPTVLYYVAYTYNRKHTCQVPAAGPYHCVLAGLNGNQYFSIRVRAATNSGNSLPGLATQTVIHPGTSDASPAQSAATTGTAAVPTSPAGAPLTPAATALSPTTSGTTPSELPFTGIDVSTLSFVGLGLVASGLLLISSSAQRRRARRRLVGWLFGI
jgi:hypothetical protein